MKDIKILGEIASQIVLMEGDSRLLREALIATLANRLDVAYVLPVKDGKFSEWHGKIKDFGDNRLRAIRWFRDSCQKLGYSVGLKYAVDYVDWVTGKKASEPVFTVIS